MKKHCININSAFVLDEGIDLNIAYEYSYDDCEEYTINISSRRNIKVNASSKADLLLVIFDYNRSLYVVEKLEFDSKRVTKLPVILDKYEINRTPVVSDTWAYFKKTPHRGNDICLYDNGYYTLERGWMDCSVWDTTVYFKDGIQLENGVIKKFYYSQAYQEMSAEYYAALEQMLTIGFSPEEYAKFKDEHIHTSFENRFVETII